MWVKKGFLSGFESVGQHLLNTARGHLRKLAKSLGKVFNLSSLSFLICELGYTTALLHRIVVLQERRLKSTSRGIWYTVSLLEKSELLYSREIHQYSMLWSGLMRYGESLWLFITLLHFEV